MFTITSKKVIINRNGDVTIKVSCLGEFSDWKEAKFYLQDVREIAREMRVHRTEHTKHWRKLRTIIVEYGNVINTQYTIKRI